MKFLFSLSLSLSGLLLSSSLIAQTNTNTFPNSGNAGIGTMSPLSPLNIRGNSGSKGIILDMNVNPGGEYSPFVIWDGRNSGANYFFGMRQFRDQFRLVRYSDFWTNKLEVLAIDGVDGKVGIGTSDPSSKLHVQDGGQDIRFLTGTNTMAICWI